MWNTEADVVHRVQLWCTEADVMHRVQIWCTGGRCSAQGQKRYTGGDVVHRRQMWWTGGQMWCRCGDSEQMWCLAT
jgi:hypothetical protein